MGRFRGLVRNDSGVAVPRSDDPGLDALYREILAELRQFAQKRLGNVADAEDVVQEAFVRFQRQENHESFENPRAYLYTTVNNLIIDRVRDRRRQGFFSDKTSDDDQDGSTPESQIDALTPEVFAEQRQDLSRVLEAVESLPPQARRAFLLHKVRHLSYAEVAKEMGLSKSTVEKHMIRALKILNKALNEDEKSTSGANNKDPGEGGDHD